VVEPEIRSSNAVLTVGVSGARQNACAAACLDGDLVAACEQERVTRVRRVGLQPGALPYEALEAVLAIAGKRKLADVKSFGIGEASVSLPPLYPVARFAHHFAHAATAYYLSPFPSAVALICDTDASVSTSVWLCGNDLKNVDWPSPASSALTVLYEQCARVFGLASGQEHQLEGLARLDGAPQDDRLERLITYRDGEICAIDGWESHIEAWLEEQPAGSIAHRASVAGAFQRRLGNLLLALLADVHRATGARHLCLGGGLFYNTFFNTIVRQSGLFEDVFVPPNPGNPGLAAGLALIAGAAKRGDREASPFLGASYDAEEIKATLDNCKLLYERLTEAQLLATTVDSLRRGLLVGWFQGRMEWGHRGLGNRSIVASPLSPYVLENLNVFLKQREWYRTYGLSVREDEAMRHFEGPPTSRLMQFEHRLRNPEALRHVVREGMESVRVQTVPDDDRFGRFHALHAAFGAATGIPVLVNTSFNAFAEPIVCSPRDAVRVFYGTGLDVLVIDRFVIRK
jgi:carbamoyltransferase